MSNIDYRPELDVLMPPEGTSKSSPAPTTPPKHLDNDAYWHTGIRHDGHGPDWEGTAPNETEQETHSAVCAIITPH